MARGDTNPSTAVIGGGADIMNRPGWTAVPMTIDFADVVKTEGFEKVVKAGTPISKDGKQVTETPWKDAVGILLEDVHESYPTGAIVTEGYVNKTRADAHSGLTYDGALVTALNNAGCRIRIEEPLTLGDVSGGAAAAAISKLSDLTDVEGEPADGNVLTYSDGESKWKPAAPKETDLSGYQTKIDVTGILKGEGAGSVVAAVSGTDYAAAGGA